MEGLKTPDKQRFHIKPTNLYIEIFFLSLIGRGDVFVNFSVLRNEEMLVSSALILVPLFL